jgi:multiple sugar transport system substrate-binding protein
VRLRRIAGTVVATGCCASLALMGCGGGPDRKRAEDTTCDGRIGETTYLRVWFHVSDEANAERATLREQVKAFNASHRQVKVTLITLPVGDYGDQVRSAAATGNLPDVVDLDGPNLYNYAWTGVLKPIGSCLPRRVGADVLPSLRRQGTYAGRLWGIGTFDSGLGLYVRTSVLRRARIRIPRGPGDAWTAAEFTGVLRRLRQAGYRRPLDLQLSTVNPEWRTYGFAPAVWSAGGDLIDRRTYRKVEGVLNGPQAVRSLSIIQRWAKAGYVDPNRDGASFVKGRTPISWVGHWVYEDYIKAFPGDVTIVPLPDFGHGTATDMGSWQWGVTANAADGDAAWQFISFLLSPAEVVRMTRANGAIPGTRSAISASPRFAAGGPENLYIRQLESGVARPRPQTPAYPALSGAFARAFDAIVIDRRPVKPALDAAARQVERNLADHQYYEAPEH